MTLAEQIKALPAIKDEAGAECVSREVVLGLVGEGSEQRSWRGIAWKDSVRASILAEEIALHFAHDCNDSMCGENADASNCETAWIEDKLTEFLGFVVNGAAAERQMKRGSDG